MTCMFLFTYTSQCCENKKESKLIKKEQKHKVIPSKQTVNSRENLFESIGYLSIFSLIIITQLYIFFQVT